MKLNNVFLALVLIVILLIGCQGCSTVKPTPEDTDHWVEVGGEIVEYVIDSMTELVIDYVFDKYGIDLRPFYIAVKSLVKKLIQDNNNQEVIDAEKLSLMVLKGVYYNGG